MSSVLAGVDFVGLGLDLLETDMTKGHMRGMRIIVRAEWYLSFVSLDWDVRRIGQGECMDASSVLNCCGAIRILSAVNEGSGIYRPSCRDHIRQTAGISSPVSRLSRKYHTLIEAYAGR